MDIGSCWKNNGEPCNGDVTSDVTRYSEMIINPEIEPLCKPDQLQQCPPYHIFSNGTLVHRTDTANFPYDAYHVYNAPGNAMHLEEPVKTSDPYSNPQPQEILQILPHPVWGEYGYPTKKGEARLGWWSKNLGAWCWKALSITLFLSGNFSCSLCFVWKPSMFLYNFFFWSTCFYTTSNYELVHQLTEILSICC